MYSRTSKQNTNRCSTMQFIVRVWHAGVSGIAGPEVTGMQ